MKDLNQLIEQSKKKICSTYFKIIDNYNGTFSIKEYVGPNKSFRFLAKYGWTIHDYLVNTINTEYPIFNIFDYKAISKSKIIKKTDDDILKDELNDVLQYFNLNANLINVIKNIKNLIVAFKLDFKQYNTFDLLVNEFIHVINNSSLIISEKSKYMLLFNNNVNNVYIELEKLKIDNARKYFNEKFKYFFVLLK